MSRKLFRSGDLVTTNLMKDILALRKSFMRDLLTISILQELFKCLVSLLL
jgi:hypothetical protein